MFFKGLVLVTGGTILVIVSDILLRASQTTGILGIVSHDQLADVGILVGLGVDLVGALYLLAGATQFLQRR